MTEKQIISDIIGERRRQDIKFGVQNHHPYKWLSILGEEVGEANKAVLEALFVNTESNEYRHSDEGIRIELMNFREELIQCATVCVAAIQSLDRNELKSNSTGKSKSNAL
jgi:hypothetical protein